MNVELTGLKIRKTCKPEKICKKIFVILLKWLNENHAIDNRIILPYMTGTLKHSMHMS